mmetsp:Transcript_23763/g.70567  ORF Transcript_23763/g.70567 Transcript_23763/m.70567 type:complete len:215 (-) Transcript_23763:556-1200(-)
MSDASVCSSTRNLSQRNDPNASYTSQSAPSLASAAGRSSRRAALTCVATTTSSNASRCDVAPSAPPPLLHSTCGLPPACEGRTSRTVAPKSAEIRRDRGREEKRWKRGERPSRGPRRENPISAPSRLSLSLSIVGRRDGARHAARHRLRQLRHRLAGALVRAALRAREAVLACKVVDDECRRVGADRRIAAGADDGEHRVEQVRPKGLRVAVCR